MNKSDLLKTVSVSPVKTKNQKSSIELIQYNNKEFKRKKLQESEVTNKKGFLDWINVNGISNVSEIKKIGDIFDLHHLVLDDIVSVKQRPKIEEYDNYLFCVLKMIYYKKQKLRTEQISIVLGNGYVISFQEKEGDVFDDVRNRIGTEKSKIRKNGADYLMYSLMDSIIDNYFLVLENIGEKIEKIESVLLLRPSPDTLSQIYSLKRTLIYLRKSVWPLREVINKILRDENKLIKQETKIYYRDLYDHTIQVIDTIESYRDMSAGMLDIYLSSLSNKMNEVMKVLTIIATIFIPLTFLAGVYGMNFKYMPELNNQFSYPIIWGIMILVAVIMVYYFRRKKWI